MLGRLDFEDLLYFRKGGEGLMMGKGLSFPGKAKSRQDWSIKAEAIEKIFLQTLGRRPYTDIPLELEVEDESDCGEYKKRKISYMAGPNERINAYVLLPAEKKGKMPAVLCQHPTSSLGKEQAVGNGSSQRDKRRAYALELVERGYITIAYDMIGAGERKYQGLEHFDTSPFYEQYPEWSVRGKDIWDAGRAVDCLVSMPEVDSERIGSIGHSQGGGLTLQAMALDKRLTVGVSNCGGFPLRLSKNPFCSARTGWWIGRPLLRPYFCAMKQPPVDMHELIALIAPRALMVIFAANDFGFSYEESGFVAESLKSMCSEVDKVYGFYGSSGNFEMLLHEKGHDFQSSEREKSYAFLDHNLKDSKKESR